MEKLSTLDKLALHYGTDKASNHHGFASIYERYLAEYAGAETFAMVELGVQEGASAKMWSDYLLGPVVWILGVDQDITQFRGVVPSKVELFQGDQVQSADCWQNYRFDLIIDDASHISSKTIGSFNAWWPLLKPGGLYVVEDIHCCYDTSYYPMHEASKCPRTQLPTTMQFLKNLADDLNYEIRGTKRFLPEYHMGFSDIEFVHFYKSICFIKKGAS